jgi:FkbM family methyltransferase
MSLGTGVAHLAALPGYVGERRARRRFKRALPVMQRNDLVQLGSTYGGYAVPVDLLTSESTCYSCGVGEDATFDLALIARTGCTVYAFDPTPRAVAYAEPIANREPLFRFFPYGVWSTDRKMTFYAPADDAHVSHSIDNLQGSHESFEAECRSLPSLMAELGHERIDLLKLDVEGAEYEILENVIDAGIDVRVVCAEFHVATSTTATISAVERLVDSGFTPVHVAGLDATFVKSAPR